MGGKLINRTQRTTTFRNDLDEAISKLSIETRIPKSKLLDEALEMLLKRYGKEIN